MSAATTFSLFVVVVVATAAFTLFVVMVAATAALALFVVVVVAAAALTFFMVVIVATAALALFVVVVVATAAFTLFMMVMMVPTTATFFFIMVVMMMMAAATATTLALFMMMAFTATAATATPCRFFHEADRVEGFFGFCHFKTNHLEHLREVWQRQHREAFFDLRKTDTAVNQRAHSLTHDVDITRHVKHLLYGRTNNPESALFVEEHVFDFHRTKLISRNGDRHIPRRGMGC